MVKKSQSPLFAPTATYSVSNSIRFSATIVHPIPSNC